MTTAGALQLEAAFLYTAVLHYPGFLDYKTDIAAWISFFDFSIVLYMNHRNRGFDDDPVCVSIAVRLLWQAMNFPEFAPRNFIVGVTRGQDVIFDEATSGNLVPVRSRLSKLRIKIMDRYGNPYALNNLDHHFELIFESFKQKRKYQNIFFNR